MRFSPALSRGRLIRRYKRFLADVETPASSMTYGCRIERGCMEVTTPVPVRL